MRYVFCYGCAGNLAMENRYGLFRQSSRVWRSLRDGDFEEEEVWSVLKDNRTDHSTSTKVVQSKESTSSSPSLSSLSVPRHVTTAARMIPRASRGGGGCDSSSSSANSNHESKIVQQSAPVNIPNWPEIYRYKNSKKAPKNGSWYRDYDNGDDDDDGGIMKYGRDSEDDNEEEHGEDDNEEDDDDGYDCYNDEYGHRVPPHEVIARRLAKSQISSFSVFEGAGRTLKGRDLSKVRNAVLTKTGFLESL